MQLATMYAHDLDALFGGSCAPAPIELAPRPAPAAGPNMLGVGATTSTTDEQSRITTATALYNSLGTDLTTALASQAAVSNGAALSTLSASYAAWLATWTQYAQTHAYDSAVPTDFDAQFKAYHDAYVTFRNQAIAAGVTPSSSDTVAPLITAALLSTVLTYGAYACLGLGAFYLLAKAL